MIRCWIETGEIQEVRVGTEARIPRSEFERLIHQAGSLAAFYRNHQHKYDLVEQILEETMSTLHGAAGDLE